MKLATNVEFQVKPKHDPFEGWHQEERTLLLSEFQHQVSTTALRQLINDTYASMGDEPYSDLVIDDVLVNGASLVQLNVNISTDSGAVRIRLINGGSHWALRLSIDSHKMLLLALDGHEVILFDSLIN